MRLFISQGYDATALARLTGTAEASTWAIFRFFPFRDTVTVLRARAAGLAQVDAAGELSLARAR